MTIKIISCGYCGRVFDVKNNKLNEHIDTIHKQDKLNIEEM